MRYAAVIIYVLVAIGMASQLWAGVKPESRSEGMWFATAAFGMLWPMFLGANLAPHEPADDPVE